MSLELKDRLKKIKVQSLESHLFFRIYKADDKESLSELLKGDPEIEVYDQIQSQLKDLVKAQNPSKNLDSEQIRELSAAKIAPYPIEEYGVWVYYPWSKRLVHLLDEEEFIICRTNRNIYKITPEEFKTLRTKKIGLIGLSVGQSVSVTMALERSFGELRIADFDDIELTNINRIRTGVHNMGLNKCISVAREIAEIDPYLKIVPFQEGIHEGNIEDFINKGGKLDVLIDECDGFDVKILCRKYAKKYGIPVLMEASDRGMLDVERYDLEPDRPLLHGLIDHLDVSRVNELKTNEEKIPFLMAFVGIDTISDRAKASMLEISQTITTWPQLASAVTLGGGITADVCRRILIDEFRDSGRYYFDVEAIIGQKAGSPIAGTRISPTAETLRELIPDTLLTGQNTSEILFPKIEKIKNDLGAMLSELEATQWLWYYENNRLILLRSLDQAEVNTPASSFSNKLGKLLTGIRISAASQQLQAEVEILGNLKAGLAPLAKITFTEAGAKVDETLAALQPMLGQRLKNKSYTPSEPISEDLKADLFKDLKRSALQFKVIEDASEVKELQGLLTATQKSRILTEAGHRAIFDLLPSFEEYSDLEHPYFDLHTSHKVALRIASNWSVINNLNKWNTGGSLAQIVSLPANVPFLFGVLYGERPDQMTTIQSGEAVQELILNAAKQGIACTDLQDDLDAIRSKNEFDSKFKSILKLGLAEQPLGLFKLTKTSDFKFYKARLNQIQLFEGFSVKMEQKLN